MDMTQIDEQWLELYKPSQKRDTIVAISNTGKYRRRNGEVGILRLRQRGTGKGDGKTAKRCYHLIAEHFLITVKRPDQNQIDHITHNPDGYEVNDVRNLRWCNKYENDHFEEAKENRSGVNSYWYGRTGENAPMYGKKHTEETRKRMRDSSPHLSGENHPMYGRTKDRAPNWKGDDVGPSGAYRRANKLYKDGKITEEEFQPYRDAWNEYQRAKRATSSTHE